MALKGIWIWFPVPAVYNNRTERFQQHWQPPCLKCDSNISKFKGFKDFKIQLKYPHADTKKKSYHGHFASTFGTTNIPSVSCQHWNKKFEGLFFFPLLIKPHVFYQWSANFFFFLNRGPDSKHFRFCGTYCHWNYPILLLRVRKQPQKVQNWMWWLCSKKTLFTKTGS